MWVSVTLPDQRNRSGRGLVHPALEPICEPRNHSSIKQFCVRVRTREPAGARPAFRYAGASNISSQSPGCLSMDGYDREKAQVSSVSSVRKISPST